MEEEEDDEEEEEHEEGVVLLCGFSESLLSDRSDVMSGFSRFRPAFFSSSSPFLRLFTASFTFAFESGQIEDKSSCLTETHKGFHKIYTSATSSTFILSMEQAPFSNGHWERGGVKPMTTSSSQGHIGHSV